FNAIAGVELGGESDAEMEELLPRVDITRGGERGMFEHGIVGDGGYGVDDRPTLVPSEIFGSLRRPGRQGHLPVPTDDDDLDLELKFISP
ncbi:putative copper-transporting ATPase 2-like, partial [Homarus americanus]